jgi:hypothetical protein
MAMETPNNIPPATENATPSRSLTAVVAAYFEARPNRWLDGREIQQVAGAYAWRTRISDARRHPYNLNIKNRQRRIKTASGESTVSEYMFVPVVVTEEIEEEKSPETSEEIVSGLLF